MCCLANKLILVLLMLGMVATQTTIHPLACIESGVVTLYNSTSIIATGAETVFTVTYLKKHDTVPIPFYFLNRYKMQDRFIF